MEETIKESQLKRGLTVYVHGQYGQYAAPEKRGKPISFKYTVTNWWKGPKASSIIVSDATEENYRKNVQNIMTLNPGTNSMIYVRVNTGSAYTLSELHLKPIGDIVDYSYISDKEFIKKLCR